MVLRWPREEEGIIGLCWCVVVCGGVWWCVVCGVFNVADVG